MPRATTRKSPLSPLEHDVMRIVWERGEAAAEDVSEALGSRFKNATVRTVLRRVEQKGYLEHRQEGRAFIYRPTVDAATAARGAIRRVLDRFYGGSVERLLVGLLDGKMIDARQLAELQARVNDAATRESKARPR
jgi:predicted transcriptional regulator